MDVVNIFEWYQNARKDKRLNGFDLKTQWLIRKNIDKILPTVESFENFRKEKTDEINEAWFTEEKSHIITTEDGQEARQINDEYLDEFNKEVSRVNNELQSILAEKVEVELGTADIDAIVEKASDDSGISVDDIEILSILLTENDKG